MVTGESPLIWSGAGKITLPGSNGWDADSRTMLKIDEIHFHLRASETGRVRTWVAEGVPALASVTVVNSGFEAVVEELDGNGGSPLVGVHGPPTDTQFVAYVLPCLYTSSSPSNSATGWLVVKVGGSTDIESGEWAVYGPQGGSVTMKLPTIFVSGFTFDPNGDGLSFWSRGGLFNPYLATGSGTPATSWVANAISLPQNP